MKSKTITFTPKELDALEWYLIKNPCEGGCIWEPHPSGESCKGCEFLKLSESIRERFGMKYMTYKEKYEKLCKVLIDRGYLGETMCDELSASEWCEEHCSETCPDVHCIDKWIEVISDDR